MIVVALVMAAPAVFASPEEGQLHKLNPKEIVFEHVLDTHAWHLSHDLVFYLPVISYTSDRGLETFSSRELYEAGPDGYRGYKLEGEKLVRTDGVWVFDLSITKNVLFLIVNAVLLLVVFLLVRRAFIKNRGKKPGGIQSVFEPIILYLRDEVIRPNIGPGYRRYLPYLLTLFFFIWFGNLLGLLPGAANFTGNIAVTLALAAGSFLLTNLSGNRHYWGHIFWPPGVPGVMKILIVPVEIIGLLTKPFSLMVRLFVAITAGHIVILSLLILIFIFKSFLVGIGATLMAVFITFIEILVATIQAYVFTMFTSLYIGMAVGGSH